MYRRDRFLNCLAAESLKCRFQSGDIVRFRDDLNDYTLYTSCDGSVCECASYPISPYAGHAVRICTAENGRYRIEKMDGGTLPGFFVDGMFDKHPIKKAGETRQETYDRFNRFASEHAASRVTASELEERVIKTLREFKAGAYYEKITNIAKLTRAAKQKVDEGGNPEDLFSQIADAAKEKNPFEEHDVHEKRLRDVKSGAEKAFALSGILAAFFVLIYVNHIGFEAIFSIILLIGMLFQIHLLMKK